MKRYAQNPRLLSKTVRQNSRTLVTWHVTYNADNKRAQSSSRRRGATAILRLVRGLTSARARSGIPRHSGNIYRPILFSNDTAVVAMAYDYMGRRFEYKETVSGTLTHHMRYLYRGYLQIAALDMLNSVSVKHSTAWDPSEPTATRPLVLRISTASYYYSFDQVKNVTELFDSSGAIAATYDYSPFGQVVAATGNISNPIAFSSEIFDTTLGLQYYNYRHLNTLDGRWVNRDPIGEEGSKNLWCFLNNAGLNRWDVLGLKSCAEICKMAKNSPTEVDMFMKEASVVCFDGQACPCILNLNNPRSGLGIDQGECPGLDAIIIEHEQYHVDYTTECKQCGLYLAPRKPGITQRQSECISRAEDIPRLNEYIKSQWWWSKCARAAKIIRDSQKQYVDEFCKGTIIGTS
jgi:RHS repeat-associated protein